MTTSPIEVREEIDVVSVDPLFIERQRNRYASRAVAYLVWAPTHTLACNPCRHCWRSVFHRGAKYGPRSGTAEGSPCRSECGHPSIRALNTKFAKALMIRNHSPVDIQGECFRHVTLSRKSTSTAVSLRTASHGARLLA